MSTVLTVVIIFYFAMMFLIPIVLIIDYQMDVSRTIAMTVFWPIVMLVLLVKGTRELWREYVSKEEE